MVTVINLMAAGWRPRRSKRVMISPISPRWTASGLISTRVRSVCMVISTGGWTRRPPYPNAATLPPPGWRSGAEGLEERVRLTEGADHCGTQTAAENVGRQGADRLGVDVDKE